MKESYKNILIDASMILKGEPLALAKVFNKPWIVIYLDTLVKAGVNNNSTILIPKGLDDLFDNFKKEYCIQIIDKVDDWDNYLVLRLDQFIIPSEMFKLLKKRRSDVFSSVIFKITSQNDFKKVEAFIYRDIYYITARYFHLPLAKKLAFKLRNTRITPNFITFASLLTGLIASILIAYGNYLYDVIGAILLQVALTLDFTDGYLARLTNKGSFFGHWFDTLVDEIINMSVILGIIFSIIHLYGWTIWGPLGAIWLLSAHSNGNIHWFTKAFNLQKNIIDKTKSEYIEHIEEIEIGRKKKLTLILIIKRVILLSDKLDFRNLIISISLILNLKTVLIVFMGMVNLLMLANTIYKKRLEYINKEYYKAD